MSKLFPLIFIGLLTACGKPQTSDVTSLEAKAVIAEKTETNPEVTATVDQTATEVNHDEVVQVPTGAITQEDIDNLYGSTAKAVPTATPAEATKPE